KVIPSALRSHRATSSLVYPLCPFWASPQAAICRRSLQGCCQFLLKLRRKQRSAHINLMATITKPSCSLRIPASDHHATPSGRVAEQLSVPLWRCALLCEPQNMPLGSLDWIFCVPIPLMQLFRCQVCLNFDALSHAS